MSIDIAYPCLFEGNVARSGPTPLCDLLERRATPGGSNWLAGVIPPDLHRGASAVPEPEPEPAIEAEPAAPPAAPVPDPVVSQRMAEAIEGLAAAQASLLKEPDIVELAMAVAQAVLQRELATRPELVIESVSEALKAMRGEAPNRVRIHPDTIEVLRAARPDLEAEGVELVRDESLGLGGCVVESQHRAFDASVEARLERFRAAFEVAIDKEDG